MRNHGLPAPGSWFAGAVRQRGFARRPSYVAASIVPVGLWSVVLFLCGPTSGACAAEPEPPVFTVLFTAESHGALLPCDCPMRLIGGVARRATLIKRFRERGPVLLVDAGNWAAGGSYDEDSDGDPQRDALRTELMAKAMALMKYDAVLLGQTERENPGFPSEAEIHVTEGSPNAAPAQDTSTRRGAHAHNPKGPIPFPEFLRPLTFELAWWSRDLRLGEQEIEVEAAPNPQQEKGRGSSRPIDFRMLLSQLGEEGTTNAARNAFDLAINAGRKDSDRTSWSSGKAVVANFDYQVQRLGVAEVFRPPEGRKGANSRRWDVRIRFIPLTKEIPEDPEVLALLQPHMETLSKKGKRRLQVEVFINAECPHWCELAPDMGRMAKELGHRVEIVPRFFVRRNTDGTFRSPHGERELQENRVQALVLRYYPERFWDWLAWRSKNRESSWEDVARDLGLVRARLAGALAAGEAESILAFDALAGQRRHVKATPTLVVGNRLYDGETGRLHLLRVFCGLLDEPRPDVCRTVPACFHDAQCRRRGVVGRCLDAGTPEARCDLSRNAVRVPTIVLVEREAIYDNHERILETLLNWLPGIEWRVLDPGEGEGKELAERVRPERYPAVLLDPVAKTEVDFQKQLGDVMDDRGGWLMIKPVATGASRIVARSRALGRADLFVSRFSRTGQEAVDVALSPRAGQPEPEVRIHDALYWQESPQPDGTVKRELTSRHGVAELQEAAIAAAVREVAPEKLAAYLRERCRRRGSLFWDRALQEAGIDVATVRLLVEGRGETGFSETVLDVLRAEADLLAELKAAGEAILLAENCEVVPVRSREELAGYLEQIGRRRGASSVKEDAPTDRVKATLEAVPSRSTP